LIAYSNKVSPEDGETICPADGSLTRAYIPCKCCKSAAHTVVIRYLKLAVVVSTLPSDTGMTGCVDGAAI